METSKAQLSWATIFKVLLAVLLAYLVVRLWPLIELLLLALLIAVTLSPLLRWTRKHGWPKWSGVLLCALVLVGFTFALFALLVPTIFSQGGEFISKLPAYKTGLLAHLPRSGPLRLQADQLFASPGFDNPEPLLKQFLAWGTIALTGVVEFFLVLIVAIYFVADGERVFEWLLAFSPHTQRKKMASASQEIVSVASHYMLGQLITSLLCGSYAFLVLLFLHVPNPILLAVLAGIFDILPLIGFFLFSIPAVLIALTVSPAAAATVAAFYLLYKFVEDYYIVPKVYGDALQLSTLTVLLSCLIAGAISGVVGIILVLPLVASYPIVERHWLRPYLQRDTVAQHDRAGHEQE